jgi:hypothetical protein
VRVVVNLPESKAKSDEFILSFSIDYGNYHRMILLLALGNVFGLWLAVFWLCRGVAVQLQSRYASKAM